MSVWNVSSVAPVLVSGFEVCGEPHLHIPHMAEKRAGGTACVRAAFCAPRSGREP